MSLEAVTESALIEAGIANGRNLLEMPTRLGKPLGKCTKEELLTLSTEWEAGGQLNLRIAEKLEHPQRDDDSLGLFLVAASNMAPSEAYLKRLKTWAKS